jgi:hypothetical protein
MSRTATSVLFARELDRGGQVRGWPDNLGMGCFEDLVDVDGDQVLVLDDKDPLTGERHRALHTSRREL